MFVTCPNCGTRFQLEPDVLTPQGRRLRCVKCSHSWTERPASAGRPVATPEPDEVPDFGVERPRRPPRPAQRRRPPPPRRRAAGPGIGNLIGWGAFAAVLLVIVVGVLFGRNQVLAVFPAATTFYEAIGLVEPPGAGLSVKIVKTDSRQEGATVILELTGEVANPSAERKAIPPMRVTLLRGRRELQTWPFRAPVDHIDPGQTVTFVASTANPNPDTTDAVIWFEAPADR
jgi:predicted Zn finger-like uncharacterized protein